MMPSARLIPLGVGTLDPVPPLRSAIGSTHTEMGINMTKNIGDIDRIARVGAAVMLLVVAWAVGFGTIGGVIATVLAVVLGATATVGECPLYLPFHINTRRPPTQGS